MDVVVTILQIVVALGIFNVWILRFGRATSYRGGSATNMKEEFDAYGLPSGSVYVVGALKILCAVLLLVGLFVPAATRPGAIGLVVLMLGAVSMHVKVRDPLRKAVPAITMLILSAIVALA